MIIDFYLGLLNTLAEENITILRFCKYIILITTDKANNVIDNHFTLRAFLTSFLIAGHKNCMLPALEY